VAQKKKTLKLHGNNGKRKNEEEAGIVADEVQQIEKRG